MYDAIAKFAPDALFGIYTGDIVRRQGWNSSVWDNADASKFFSIPSMIPGRWGERKT